MRTISADNTPRTTVICADCGESCRAPSTYLGGELIDFIIGLRQELIAELAVSQVADHKVIGSRRRETGAMKINAADPASFCAQALDHVGAYESARATYKNSWLLHKF